VVLNCQRKRNDMLMKGRDYKYLTDSLVSI
jgi:hypothetical protein